MGYCAKYLIETVMCAFTGRVVDFVILQKGLFQGEMEAKGLRFLLNRLKKVVRDQVETICTDRNNSVRKLMREEFPEIIHEYDIWHLAKSLKKRLKKLFKGSKVLFGWMKSIGNHPWWCAQTCGGCAETIVHKWKSLLMHARNIHTDCEHEPIDQRAARKKAWVLEVSDVRKLANFVNDKKLTEDLKHCTQFVHTGNLESVHSKANLYRPKKHYFSYLGMFLRTCLAYIDHNSNLEKNVVSEVSEFSKETGQWMARKVFERNDYTWLKEEAALVLANMRSGDIVTSEEEQIIMMPFILPKNIAPVPKVQLQDMDPKRTNRFD